MISTKGQRALLAEPRNVSERDGPARLSMRRPPASTRPVNPGSSPSRINGQRAFCRPPVARRRFPHPRVAWRRHFKGMNP